MDVKFKFKKFQRFYVTGVKIRPFPHRLSHGPYHSAALPGVTFVVDMEY